MHAPRLHATLSPKAKFVRACLCVCVGMCVLAIGDVSLFSVCVCVCVCVCYVCQLEKGILRLTEQELIFTTMDGWTTTTLPWYAILPCCSPETLALGTERGGDNGDNGDAAVAVEPAGGGRCGVSVNSRALDLPEPEPPRMVKVSPRTTSRSTPRSTGRPSKALWIPSSSITASPPLTAK